MPYQISLKLTPNRAVVIVNSVLEVKIFGALKVVVSSKLLESSQSLEESTTKYSIGGDNAPDTRIFGDYYNSYSYYRLDMIVELTKYRRRI